MMCTLKDAINSTEGSGRMVPWWAVPLALVAGVVIGIILIALVSANQEDD